ncbi:MAG TPA: helix-turn-helix transcriptional regulator [bacterium]|nr:helix-turn-helix transcriptional regulator [bacterium]
MSTSLERYREWSRQAEDDPRLLAEEMKLAFADGLVRLLEARGVKRTELAEKLGTNRGYVTRILNTEYNLSIETMAKIALALDARVTLNLQPRRRARTSPADAYLSTAGRHTRRVVPVASDFMVRDRQPRGQSRTRQAQGRRRSDRPR